MSDVFNYTILILIALMIMPVYYIGVYFLFLYLKERYTGVKPASQVFAEQLITHQDDISEIKEKMDNFKDEVTKEINDNVENKVDEKIEKEDLNLKHLAFLTKLEYMRFRNSLSIDNIEEKVNKVVRRVVDNFMMARYLHNKKYLQVDGRYILPEINDRVRDNDLHLIYAQFRGVISDEFLEEISLVYKMNEIKTENFLIAHYIAPLYNREIENMKTEYRENEKRLTLIEKERAKRLNNEFYDEEQERVKMELAKIKLGFK